MTGERAAREPGVEQRAINQSAGQETPGRARREGAARTAPWRPPGRSQESSGRGSKSAARAPATRTRSSRATAPRRRASPGRRRDGARRHKPRRRPRRPAPPRRYKSERARPATPEARARLGPKPSVRLAAIGPHIPAQCRLLARPRSRPPPKSRELRTIAAFHDARLGAAGPRRLDSGQSPALTSPRFFILSVRFSPRREFA